MDRFVVCTTIGGGSRGYGVEDRINISTWPKRFNLTEEEAENLVEKYNNKKTSWWDNFWFSKELNDLKNGIIP